MAVVRFLTCIVSTALVSLFSGVGSNRDTHCVITFEYLSRRSLETYYKSILSKSCTFFTTGDLLKIILF